ncbi:hypothetical protein GGQ85_003911 [Nitrobacter vulgaris]|jgi:hypothetical protein|uniref:hypothetical protein n=1 Tax=Nitrobacter vulgaris TaxID=29421 RepID=UPI002855879C|nr:hypothetical protein [Nitrobacter vulgaris]MDR6306183.1 hypothetical protein [Nitrobacter vulgaris]
MPQADQIPITSRRRFLSILGLAGAATAATTVAAAAVSQKPEIEELPSRYERPLEYLKDMQAIGWKPAAMFQRLKEGGVLRMGVIEKGPGEERMTETWGKYHAISMRCPVQLPMDVHPDQGWWKEVWQFLYDRGLREDVTPTSIA